MSHATQTRRVRPTGVGQETDGPLSGEPSRGADALRISEAPQAVAERVVGASQLPCASRLRAMTIRWICEVPS